MRIYIAGPYTNGAYREVAETVRSYPHVLESFHYIGKHPGRIRADKRKVFLDSGAFSAFTTGAEIKLEAYAAFMTKNSDIVEFAANLDNISKDMSAEGRREGARISDANFRRMRALVPESIYIIPVFHFHEPLEFLERMVAKFPFIAIGGMAQESTPVALRMLDEYWDRVLTDREGRPKLRVHGFGLTTYDLMLRYPWWSVDSTSWVMSGAFGSIRLMNAEGKPVTISISGKSPKRKDMDRHFESLSSVEQAEIERLVRAKGFTLAELRADGTAGMLKRGAFNIEFHRDLMGRNAKTFKKETQGFF